LPTAGKGDDYKTRRKQANEIRRALLIILCYCMLQVHCKELVKNGRDVLATFVHIFENNYSYGRLVRKGIVLN